MTIPSLPIIIFEIADENLFVHEFNQTLANLLELAIDESSAN